MDATQLERDARYRATPRGQYAHHKHNARNRGVEWLLTFEQWWDIWQRSGHWSKRGNCASKFCMVRIHDTGPYAVDNVVIAPFRINSADRNHTWHGNPDKRSDADLKDPPLPE